MKISDKLIKAAILDMDGVLWRLNHPLCNLEELFKNFNDQHIKVVLATNNGTHTVEDYLKKLSGFGVQLQDWQIVTSSMALAYLVKKYFIKGGPIYITGSAALHETLKENGFYHSQEDALAVVSGLDWEFNYSMIKNTSLMIQKGLPFFFTNPDPTYPTPDGNVPGAGTFLAALEAASGSKAQLAGKPEPFLFELAMQRMQSSPDETMVIGDRLNTDILGGYNAGCPTVFVLSGINSKKDLLNWHPQPDLTIDNVSDLFPK